MILVNITPVNTLSNQELKDLIEMEKLNCISVLEALTELLIREAIKDG